MYGLFGPGRCGNELYQGGELPTHHYFMSRAKTRSLAKNAKQDDELGTDQQLLMDDMVQDLIQYLRDLKHYGRCPITGETYDTPTMLSLRGLSLDKCEWGSLPVKYAEWHLMELSIDQDQPLPAIGCINKESITSLSLKKPLCPMALRRVKPPFLKHLLRVITPNS